ncbi:MAG: aminotransferase class V-fold PLP-dependent enzyme [Pseudonocardiaceae bacterium]
MDCPIRDEPEVAQLFNPNADRYFAAYYRALLPRRTAQTLAECIGSRLVPDEDDEVTWGRYANGSRAALARALRSPEATLAFTGSASEGVAMVLSARSWGPADTILALASEYPRYLHFLEQLANRTGCQVTTVRTFEELLERTVAPVRMVIVSHVCWWSGQVRDMQTLTRRAADADAEVVVDVVHSLGVLPLDLSSWRASFVVGNSRKWALGLEGLGFLHIRDDLVENFRRDFHSTARHTQSVSYHERERTAAPESEGYKLEIGGRHKLAQIALRSSLELMLELGFERISDHVDALARLAIELLREQGFQVPTVVGASRLSGITAVELGSVRQALQVRGKLAGDGFQVAVIDNRLMIASHVFNRKETVVELVAHLRRAVTSH